MVFAFFIWRRLATVSKPVTIGAGFQAGVNKFFQVSKPVQCGKFRKKRLKPLYISIKFPNPRFKPWAMKTNVNITVSTVFVS